jgi:hypothetical protein
MHNAGKRTPNLNEEPPHAEPLRVVEAIAASRSGTHQRLLPQLLKLASEDGKKNLSRTEALDRIGHVEGLFGTDDRFF